MKSESPIKSKTYPKPSMPLLPQMGEEVEPVQTQVHETGVFSGSSSEKPLGEKIALLFTLIMLGCTIGFCSITAYNQYSSSKVDVNEAAAQQYNVESAAKN